MSAFGAESIFGDVISDSIGSLRAAVTTARNASKDLSAKWVGANYGPPIAALQNAAGAAVQVVGPGLTTLLNAPEVSGPAHAVWMLNGKLAAVNSGTSATSDDLLNAIAIAQSMAEQYDSTFTLVKSKVPAAGGAPAAAATAAPAPKPAPRPAPVYVAATAAPPTAAPAPSTALAAPQAGAPQSLATTVAMGTGGVVGLLLGGAVGWRAGAHVGLYVGGPLGAVFGAGAGWALMRALNLSPQPASA